jgi:hypothetical protein
MNHFTVALRFKRQLCLRGGLVGDLREIETEKFGHVLDLREI